MATGKKKQVKMKQKEYLTLIETPSDVERWLVNTNNNDESKSPAEKSSPRDMEKDPFKVNGKDYLKFFDELELEKEEILPGNKVSKDQPTTPKINNKKKDHSVKVKQKDLIKSINEGYHDKTNGFDRMPESTKHKRYVFTEHPTKRIIFKAQGDSEIQREPHGVVKRYHSPREISTVLEKCSSPTRVRKKHERTRLQEENPVDLGSLIWDKFSSMKSKQFSKESSFKVRNKIPVFNGNSKKYDLVKEEKSFKKGDADIQVSKAKSPGTKSVQSDQEIFISLDRKSPSEKKDLIYETMPELFSASVENDSLSDRKFSIDGVPSSSGKESIGFSDLNDKDEMLF